MRIILREATKADCGTLLTLVRELAAYEKLEHEVTADVRTLRNGLFGKHPRAFALIAEADGVPAGFCIYFYNFSTFLGRAGLYIEDLYVRPQFRKAGVGKKLLARVCRIARKNRCGRVEWSVLDWNTPAINFYRKLGANRMDEWTIYRLPEDKYHAVARA